MTNGQEGCVISGVKLRGGCFVGGQRTRNSKTKKQKKPCWQKKKHMKKRWYDFTHIHVNSRLCVKSHLTHSIMLHTSIAFTYWSFFTLTRVSMQFTLYEQCLMTCVNKRLYRPLCNFKYNQNSQSHLTNRSLLCNELKQMSYTAFNCEFKRCW